MPTRPEKSRTPDQDAAEARKVVVNHEEQATTDEAKKKVVVNHEEQVSTDEE